jgi:hypothetical protein
MKKNFITVVSVFITVSILMFFACTDKNKENIWDNGSYGNGNYGDYQQIIRLTAVLRDGETVLRNGILEKGFRGIAGYSINMEWKDEYKGRANELVVTAVGNIPQDIVDDYLRDGSKTTVRLLIRSSQQFDEEGPTPALRADNSVDIEENDIDVIVAKFTNAFAEVALEQGLSQNPIIIEPKWDDGLPEINPDIPQRPTDGPNADRMFFQFNNKTKGEYKDDQIYIVIIGLAPRTGQWHYVDKDGVMHPIKENLNNMEFPDKRTAADLSFKLSDGLGVVPNAKYLYMPNIESGRMFISYKKPVYIQCFDNGFAGPDVNNPTDPNADTYFEFIEFTIEEQYHGNTTRVDFFSFPIVTSLHGANGVKTVGEIGTRAEIYAAWQNEVPNEFKSLAEPLRILAPCKRTFNDGQTNAHYFDAYVNELWDKWKNNEAVFYCGDAGIIRGRVGEDNVLKMVRDGHIGNTEWGDIRISKPNTQDVLEGKNTLDNGNQGSRVGSLATQAQVCAAINRGVAHLEKWDNASLYYKTGKPANHYSKFWHDHSIDAHAYGFCYDDVFDHATLLYDPKPIALVIDLKW